LFYFISRPHSGNIVVSDSFCAEAKLKNAARRRFILGVVAGYAAFGAAWILLSDRLLVSLTSPSVILELGVAKGLAFIAVTTALLFVALHAAPPAELTAAPMETRLRIGPYRLAAALLPPVAAFSLHWVFWESLHPFPWLLFFPAVFISSWIGGVFGGVAAATVSTLAVWWAFLPPVYSFELERPSDGFPIGLFFGVGVLTALAHERLRRAEKLAAEAKFHGLVEQALAGIYILQDERIRYANAEFARMFGYAHPGEIVGRLGLADLTTAEDCDSLTLDVARCLSGELAELRCDFTGVRRDRVMIDVETDAHRLDFNGRPAVIGVVLDVTHRRRAETALKQSESLMRAVVNGSTDAIFVKDCDGRYLLFNDAAGRYVGKNPDQVIGRDDREIFPPDIAVHVRSLDRAVMDRGAVVTHEENIRTLDGRHIIFMVTKGPIYAVDGTLVGLFGISRDVTESRQTQAALHSLNQRLEAEVAVRTEELREVEERTRLILQSSGAGMFGCDLNGKITFVNAAACRMLNCREDQMIGRSVHSLPAPQPGRDAVIALEGVLIRGAAVKDDDATFMRMDETPLPVSYAAQPMRRDDRIIGAVVSFTDTSERRAAEEAREKVLEETRRLAQSRSAFLANMSHEIRTPLNAVLGLAQVGKQKSAGRTSQALFRQILDSGRQLLEIVDGVLDYSKMEAGKLAVEPTVIDPGVAIDRAVGLIAERAAEKRLRFRVEETADFPARCRGDVLRLSQILSNLLSNAVKFTPQEGAVALLAGVDGDHLAFRVTDTGVGVAQDHLEHLFTPYEQADTSITRRFGGTGLGLSISKRLAEAMGGEIRVFSRLGQGSSFELRLPLTDAEASKPMENAPVVAACGLDAAEIPALADALEQRGVSLMLSSPGPCAAVEADLLLLDGACLQIPAVVAAAEKRLAEGRRLALVCWPMAALTVPASLSERMPVIERPLRARHILAALAPHPGPKPAPTTQGRRLAGYRVLVAEDNDVNQLVAQEMLEMEGAEHVAAVSGREAVERVLQEGAAAFDVVLMDVQMPDMDGYEATQRLREISPSLPVIGLTAHAMAEERARCLAAGMVEHLTKPVEIDRLVATIRRHARGAPALPAPAVALPAPPTPPTLIDDQPVVHWEKLEARYNGKREFIDRLAATIISAHADEPEALRRAAETEDFPAIAFLAHGVKSMAGNIIAVSLQEAAITAENAARLSEPQAVNLALRLAQRLDELFVALAKRVETGQSDSESGRKDQVAP
jgi:PAS domain S-box-containing protein